MAEPEPPTALTLPDGTTVESRFVDLPEVRLHVVSAGPADGPLVILLHGFPECWYGWRHQVGPLAAAGYRVLAPDQRGYNLSDKPGRLGAYGLDHLAADVAGLVDAAGAKRVAVVGHDWGALAAWWAAIRFPELVSRLAILNVPHPVVMRWFMLWNRAQRRRSWYVFFFQLPWWPEWMLARDDFRWAQAALTRTSRPGTFTAADLAVYRRAWSQPGALRGMLSWYRAALRRPPGRPANIRVTVPTRILWGERDRFLGSELVAPSLELCDQAEAELMPTASHWLQHEEPAWVTERLLAHLAPLGG